MIEQLDKEDGEGKTSTKSKDDTSDLHSMQIELQHQCYLIRADMEKKHQDMQQQLNEIKDMMCKILTSSASGTALPIQLSTPNTITNAAAAPPQDNVGKDVLPQDGNSVLASLCFPDAPN